MRIPIFQLSLPVHAAGTFVYNEAIRTVAMTATNWQQDMTFSGHNHDNSNTVKVFIWHNIYMKTRLLFNAVICSDP